MVRKLTVLLDDELDKRFREAVFRSKGMRRGNLTKAIEEALEQWIDKQFEKEEK